MDSDRLRRAEAEAQVAQLRDELSRLSDERLRLTRKNERLTYTLCVLRESGLEEVMQQFVEDALGFDGREPDLGPDFALSGFDLLPDQPDEPVATDAVVRAPSSDDDNEP